MKKKYKDFNHEDFTDKVQAMFPRNKWYFEHYRPDTSIEGYSAQSEGLQIFYGESSGVIRVTVVLKAPQHLEPEIFLCGSVEDVKDLLEDKYLIIAPFLGVVPRHEKMEKIE